MSYIVYIEVDENGVITRQHKDPFNHFTGLKKTMSELLSTGYLTDPFPEPDQVEGKQTVAMWDGEKVYYEYVDNAETPSNRDEINKLKQKVDMQDRALEEILYTIIPEITEGGNA